MTVFADTSCRVGTDARIASTYDTCHADLIYGTITKVDYTPCEVDADNVDSSTSFGGTFGVEESVLSR